MPDVQLAAKVMAEIEQEVEEVAAEIEERERAMPELEQAKDAAWDEFMGDGPNAPVDEAAQARYDAAWVALKQTVDSRAALVRKIDRLRSPEEFDRRMERQAQQEGVTRMADKTPSNKTTARDQGVPDVYLNETGNFKIGQDARLKSDLVQAALGLENPNALHEFSPAEAEKLIQARGWQHFLDRKKEILAEKERKQAESQTRREEQARERAEAKAAKQAEKAAEKAAASDEAKPDPKPTSSRSRKKAGARN